jgi:hypothetical protein
MNLNGWPRRRAADAGDSISERQVKTVAHPAFVFITARPDP